MTAIISDIHDGKSRRGLPGGFCTLRRNPALNPYDQHGDNGFPPQRGECGDPGEAVFASCNAMSGVEEKPLPAEGRSAYLKAPRARPAYTSRF